MEAETKGIQFEQEPMLIERVLSQAKHITVHPSRPSRRELHAFNQALIGDLDIESTLEESVLMDSNEKLFIENTVPQVFSCVAMLDTSASMAGEKHLVVSVGVAVLLLKIPGIDLGIEVFNSQSHSVKGLSFAQKPENTVSDFLRIRPTGFTDIALGLEKGLKHFAKSGVKRKIGFLMTDGRSTLGADPIEQAKLFDRLIVLHLHGPGSYLEASEEIALAGNGLCLEVHEFRDLPQRMYEAVRILSRR